MAGFFLLWIDYNIWGIGQPSLCIGLQHLHSRYKQLNLGMFFVFVYNETIKKLYITCASEQNILQYTVKHNAFDSQM